ncbi:MAG TPA: hypothetical protein VKI62_09045, partial [Bacteroidota bacterium]|nr:hypothetical protein [Bacteroidota bacterium]
MTHLTDYVRGSRRTDGFTTTIFILLASVIFFSFLTIPTVMAASAHNNTATTQAQRNANAKQQLLLHQHRLQAKASEQKSVSSSVNPSGASISINKQVSTSSTIFFHDDLEHGTSGWTVVSPGDSAAWHLSTQTGSHSWHAGIEGKTYETGARVYDELISPSINLSGALGSVALLFDEYYSTEQGWDFCMVDVTTDGGTNWIHLRGGYGESVSGSTQGQWKISSLDLTPYANQTINVRFVFDTGDSLNNYFEGWYVDDISVFDQSARISGAIYYDQNRNGTFDPDEIAIGGGLPFLITGPVSFSENLIDGKFSLPVPLGSYQIQGGLWYTLAPWTRTTPETLNVVLNTPGQIADSMNFGYYRPACIVRGMVFKDLNHNGIYNNGEPAFTDPVIELEDANFNWVDDTHADSTGQFSFLMPISGQSLFPQYCYYHLAEYMLPANWVSTVPYTDDPYPGQPPTYGFSLG